MALPLKKQTEQAHIYSASQINMYLGCPAQYEFRYLDGLKKPPTSSMAQGRAYHTGIATNYEQKIASHEDLPVADVQDAYATALDAEAVEIDWFKDEKSKGIDTVKGDLKDTGVQMIEVYQADMAPKIQPAEVEAKVSIEFDNVPYTFVGYIDLLDDKKLLHDHKLTKKTPSKDAKTEQYIVAPRDMIQGAIYLMARPEATGITFDYSVTLKTPKIVQVPADITKKDTSFVLGLTALLDDAIHKGVFYPNRNHFMCSRRQCGYWSECEKRHGGRVKP